MRRRKESRSDIVLIKAAQVMPFVETVSRRGGDLTTLSEKAGMPLEAVIERQGLIGERSAWRFIGYAADALGLEHLGHIVALEHAIQSTGELGGMRVRYAATLGKLLEFFIEDVTYENNGARYELVPSENGVQFRREVIFPDCIGRWQTEQYVVTVLIQIIRLCAGRAWLPTRMWLASSKHPLAIPVMWSDVEIEWGHSSTAMLIESELLRSPVVEGIRELENHHDRAPGVAVTSEDIDYVVDRQIWSGNATLEAAAREFGFSTSTLKRQLRKSGRVFSDVVGERRHYWARRLLSETSTPVGGIAKTLGYGHIPNFTRAFRARSGVPPSAFRAGQRSI